MSEESRLAEFPKLHVSGHPLIRHTLTLLSDERTDTRMFRELVRELTSLLVYEAMADVPLRSFPYRTPLEESTGYALEPRIGLVPIIRAHGRPGRGHHPPL